MGKIKKIGIGFGIIIGSFIVLVIISQVWMASLTPEERQQLEEKREAEALQKEIDAKQEREARELIELSKQKQAEREEAKLIEEEKAKALQKQKEETKLDTEDLQTLIVGFESYNKTVKMLLDMCVNVESETDFRLLGLLIAESGDDFLENTAGYGAVRDRLMAEGYGEHPVLGPLMDQSVILVDQMSTCMEVLAWEFSG